MKQSINILFVDDQWCCPENRCVILAEYGILQEREPSYIFHYETAEDIFGGYSVEPVIRRIKEIPELDAVVLDIMFGDTNNRLGLDILAAIRQKYPLLPVFMMTSLEDEDNVRERAMKLGANEFLIKKPTLQEFETVVRNHLTCQKGK